MCTSQQCYKCAFADVITATSAAEALLVIEPPQFDVLDSTWRHKKRLSPECRRSGCFPKVVPFKGKLPPKENRRRTKARQPEGESLKNRGNLQHR